MKPMEWKKSKLSSGKYYWCASRPYHDGVCNFIYTIYESENGDGYYARACNNAFGASRIAVKSKNRKTEKPSVFKNLNNLMSAIEKGEILWMYISHCNCIGKITKEEY
jgi:hypothetical protein